MFVVHSYSLAVVLCVITMFCWGSWANTRKLASKGWRFELFYCCLLYTSGGALPAQRAPAVAAVFQRRRDVRDRHLAAAQLAPLAPDG